MDMNETLKILVTLARIPIYTASDILELMNDLGVEERGFALLMNVSTTTVRQTGKGYHRSGAEKGRGRFVLSDTPIFC